MPTEDLLEKIKEIKATEKEFKISPRYLVNAFGFEKRTSGNRSSINRFLEEQQLEIIPDYLNVWIDDEVTLRHKKKAKSKRITDAIQRIKLIPAANCEPISVKKESSLGACRT